MSRRWCAITGVMIAIIVQEQANAGSCLDLVSQSPIIVPSPVEKNQEIAARLYHQAQIEGPGLTMARVPEKFDRHGRENASLARSLYEQAGQLGHTGAILNLSTMLEDGQVGVKDEWRAFTLRQRIAGKSPKPIC